MATVVKWTLDESGIMLLKKQLENFWVDWTDLGQQASGWSLAARMHNADTWIKYKHIGDGLYQTYLYLPEGNGLVVTQLLPLLGPGEIIDSAAAPVPDSLELGQEVRLTEPAPSTANPSFVERIKAFFGFGDKA